MLPTDADPHVAAGTLTEPNGALAAQASHWALVCVSSAVIWLIAAAILDVQARWCLFAVSRSPAHTACISAEGPAHTSRSRDNKFLHKF